MIKAKDKKVNINIVNNSFNKINSLSIIIPCFNEYDRLYKNLPLLVSFCYNNFAGKGIDYEIIFVNDGSTDKTLKLLKSIKHTHFKIISYDKNMGKGYAVKRGLLASRMDRVLFMDADLATDLSCINTALITSNCIIKDFILVGNRELPESVVSTTTFRRLMGRMFSLIQYIIVGINVSDTQCGFKLMSKNVAHIIAKDLEINGWAFDIELLYLCKESNIIIESMPVIWVNGEGSKVHPIRDSIRMFKELIRIRRIHG
jgi:dolichyl-phosphate beta-glucosyltransferase